MSITQLTQPGPIGHYEAILSVEKDGEQLNIVPVIKKPDNISLAQPKSSEKAAIPISNIMKELKIETEKFPEPQMGLLFTKEQRKAIYEAIEKNKDLIKIRRTWAGAPGEKINRISNKTPTELERNLNLEFSVIIDDNREPIALYRGKGFAIGSGAFGQVKFGQRLSDGKWVAVKIQKYDLNNINALNARLKMLHEKLSEKSLNLSAGQLKLKDSTLKSSQREVVQKNVSHLENEIASLNNNIRSIELFLKEQEQKYHSKRGYILSESKIEKELNVQSGSASRISADKEKFYSVQTLFDGRDLFYYAFDKEFSGYIRDERERLQTALLALKALKNLHDKNIVHGDIKSENMIYIRDPSGQNSGIQIIDFGQSIKVDGEKPTQSVWIGTKMYSAPEVLQSNMVSKSSDIYSMGKLFGFMLHEVHCPLDSPLKDDVAKLIKRMQNVEPQNRITVDAAIQEMEKIIQEYDNKPKMRYR